MRVKKNILEIARSKTKSVWLLTTNRIVPYGAGTIKWYFNIMLSIILTLTLGYKIGLAIVLFLGMLFGFFALKGKKKKTRTYLLRKESSTAGPGDFELKNETGSWDNTCYQSVINSKIMIREIRVFNSRHEEKDKLTFASSLPFHFNAEDRKSLKELIPGLIEVFVVNSHELMLLKSPAASFYDLDVHKAILTHLFIYLNRKYAWMNKKIIVSWHYFGNNKLSCHLPEQARNHVRLGVLLGDIPGIINCLHTIAQMEEKNIYQFDIEKETNLEWADILPKIQEAFNQYFTNDVEFIGPN